MNDQNRYYVIETNCSNPVDDDVSHVAVEIRPGAVWRLAVANLLVRPNRIAKNYAEWRKLCYC